MTHYNNHRSLIETTKRLTAGVLLCLGGTALGGAIATRLGNYWDKTGPVEAAVPGNVNDPAVQQKLGAGICKIFVYKPGEGYSHAAEAAIKLNGTDLLDHDPRDVTWHVKKQQGKPAPSIGDTSVICDINPNK